MNAAKQIANRMIEELPDEMVGNVISYLAFIRSERQNQVFRDLERAALTSTEFWDNAIDDEVWNNA